jgi:glycosyltransferase involved in cell wall biosynthesis
MKILILSWRGPGHPNAGGAEKSTHEHAKAWVSAGYSVTLFTSFYPGAKTEEAIDGVSIIRRGRDVFGVQLAAFSWYVFGSHPKFDLVVDQFHGIPFFTPLYVRTKKLAFIHEVAKEVWWLNPWPKPFNLIPGTIGSLLEPLVFKLLYTNIPFMTVSDSTKKDLVEMGIPERNITVVHNGVNIVEVKADKEEKKTALFLGALTKDKGIEDAIKVFSLINQSRPDWQFWVTGKGDRPYTEKLKLVCRDLEIENKVKFWGFVPEKKKFELLARAHVLINPSVREGWGLVNIEANSVGTPVIAYNVPGCRDSVVNGKTGLLSQKGDIRELAKNCLELESNERMCEEFRKNAIEISRNFNWKKSAQESLRLIGKICTK